MYFDDNEPRLIGLDYGTVRCGLAVADTSRTLASPLAVVATEPRDTLGQRVLDALGGKPVAELVVGLPLNQNGTEGPAADEARRIGTLVSETLGCPLHYMDERYTTAEMHVRRKEAGISGKQRAKDIDAWAAATILQSWLDREKLQLP